MEEVERHLSHCPACQRELASLRRAQNLLTAYRKQEPPPPRSDWSGLRARILSEGAQPLTMLPLAQERRRPARANWLPRLQTVGAFAAGLLVVVISYHLLPSKNATVSEGVGSGKSAAVAPNSGPSVSRETSNSDEANSWLGSSQKSKPPVTVAKSNAREVSETAAASFLNVFSHMQFEPVSYKEAPKTEPSSRIATNSPSGRDKQGSRRMESNQASSPGIKLSPVDKSKLERPKDGPQDENRPTYETVSNQRYVMGSLVPISHDDDTVY